MSITAMRKFLSYTKVPKSYRSFYDIRDEFGRGMCEVLRYATKLAGTLRIPEHLEGAHKSI